MAKVTITLEDIERDGQASLRMSVNSDNQASKEYTLAETVAEQLYAIVISQAENVSNITLPTSRAGNDDTTLN
jgi:hypothetical protein